MDERSSAFFALGLAKSTLNPVVVLSTSGTAAANFFPAITLEEIIKVLWFPELYPKPCQNVEQLKETLTTFIDSPELEYNKYLCSINHVQNNKVSSNELWKTIENISG